MSDDPHLLSPPAHDDDTDDGPGMPPMAEVDPGDVAALVDAVAPLEVEGEPDAAREGLHLLSVGGARVAWEAPGDSDDTVTITVRLRRPTFGEIRSIDRLLNDTTTEARDEGQELRARAAALEVEARAPDTDPARVREIRWEAKDISDAYTDRHREARLAWWLFVFDKLGTNLPAGGLGVDDLPAWLADPILPNRLVGHYQRVPTVRG